MVALLFAALAGCATVAPDPALVRWADSDAWWSAVQHADRIQGIAYRAVGTSMEPFIVAGDWEVADFSIPFSAIKPGYIPVYDPNWMDASVPLMGHMAVERTGACWVVTGINNQYSESGARALCEADYRALVVAIYTPRPKP